MLDKSIFSGERGLKISKWAELEIYDGNEIVYDAHIQLLVEGVLKTIKKGCGKVLEK